MVSRWRWRWLRDGNRCHWVDHGVWLRRRIHIDSPNLNFPVAKCYDKTASKLQKTADAPREREMREENWNRSCKRDAKLVCNGPKRSKTVKILWTCSSTCHIESDESCRQTWWKRSASPDSSHSCWREARNQVRLSRAIRQFSKILIQLYSSVLAFDFKTDCLTPRFFEAVPCCPLNSGYSRLFCVHSLHIDRLANATSLKDCDSFPIVCYAATTCSSMTRWSHEKTLYLMQLKHVFFQFVWLQLISPCATLRPISFCHMLDCLSHKIWLQLHPRIQNFLSCFSFADIWS